MKKIKINRKIFSLSLALVMLIGVIIPALAIEPVEEYDTLPELFADAVEGNAPPVIHNMNAYSATSPSGIDESGFVNAVPGEIVIIYGEVTDADHPTGVITPHLWSGEGPRDIPAAQRRFGQFPEGTLGYDFNWLQGDEGTYDDEVNIRVRTGQNYAGTGANRRRTAPASAAFTVPADAKPGDIIEIVFQAVDDGEPRLSASESIFVRVGYAKPSVYPPALYISTSGSELNTGQFSVSLGDGDNRAASVSVRLDAASDKIYGSDHGSGFLQVSSSSLTDDGDLTVTAIGNGTGYVILEFKDAQGNLLEDYHYRVMAIDSVYYANLEYSRFHDDVQAAVDHAHQRRVELGRVNNRPRYIATSDNETDDMNTMVRTILYANEIDIVGIVYSSATHHWRGDGETLFTGGAAVNPMVQYRWMGSQSYQAFTEAYRLVQDNLQSFDPDFPDADYLRDMIFEGNIAVVSDMIGDTPGSDLIKYNLLDKRDSSQVIMTSWGGSNTIAMALYSIERDFRTSPDAEANIASLEGFNSWEEIYNWVIDRAVIYNIGTQDVTTSSYIERNWPNITLIVNNQFSAFAFGASHNANTPYNIRYFFRDEFHANHILHRGITRHYQTYNDGLNLMNISWDPNVPPTEAELNAPGRPVRLARGAAERGYFGHIEPTMGWYPRFIQGNLTHNNHGRQGLNSGSPDNIRLRGDTNATNIALMGSWEPAPWSKGARMHRLICPIADDRWYEFGEPQHEDFGSPRLISYWGFGNPSRDPGTIAPGTYPAGVFPGVYWFYSEGDTPSVFYAMYNGLRNFENPSYGGWGQRFVQNAQGRWVGPTNNEADFVPGVVNNGTVGPNAMRNWYSQQRWAPAQQYDFAARIAWTLDASALRAGERHNRYPEIEVVGALDRYAAPGSTVNLVGKAVDPDGDALEIKWWRYWEADTYDGRVTAAAEDISIPITGADTLSASFVVPANARDGQTIHIIYEVKDVAPEGAEYFTPLTKYQRVIFTVHTPGDRLVTVEPTRTTEGAWEIYCEICGELLESGIIPKLAVVGAVTAPRDFVSMRETQKGSRVWALTFNALVTLEDEEGNVVGTERAEYTILLNGNNANLDGRFTFDPDHELAGRTLIYDIKGNGSNIKALRFA